MMTRIRALRKEQNMSQRTLADKIGASQKSVDYWEKEQAEPTAKFICALADCFGCSIDFLLGREDDFGNVNVQSDLSEQEKRLLSDFRRLDENDREQIGCFAQFLLARHCSRG